MKEDAVPLSVVVMGRRFWAEQVIENNIGNCESRIPGDEFEQIVPDFISGNYLNTKIPLKDVDWT